MPEISSPPVPTTPAAASDSAISTVSIPSDVQEAIEKPFSALNNFLKTTQENIRQAQQQAEEMKAAASTTTGGSDYSSQKVPTLAEYLAAPIVEQRKASSSAALTERTAVDIKLPEMDIKLPSVNIKLPDVPLPEFGTEPVTPVVVPPGKALPLGDYFRAKVSGALPADPTVQSSVANAKTKIGIMLANFYQLIGRDAPATLDLSDLSKSVENFGFDDLKAMVESIPVGAPLTAFAVGTFLVVLGGRNELAAKNEKPPTPQTMEAASAALGSLTDDLVRYTNLFFSLFMIGFRLSNISPCDILCKMVIFLYFFSLSHSSSYLISTFQSLRTKITGDATTKNEDPGGNGFESSSRTQSCQGEAP
jgi:hypothetical protein